MSSKGMTWDAVADRKLFLGILKMQNIVVDTEAMARYMSTEDVTCTASAIQNRVKKLKAMAKDDTTTFSTGDDEGTPKPKATTRKRAGGDASGESPAKKGKKGKGEKAKSTEVQDDDEEEASTKMGIKKEDAEDDELV